MWGVGGSQQGGEKGAWERSSGARLQCNPLKGIEFRNQKERGPKVEGKINGKRRGVL